LIGNDAVQAETITEVHRKEIERAYRVHEQAFDEGVASFGRIGHARHWTGLLLSIPESSCPSTPNTSPPMSSSSRLKEPNCSSSGHAAKEQQSR
jgi:hypothetical protein